MSTTPSTLLMPLDALTSTTGKQLKRDRRLRKNGRTPLAIKRDAERLARDETPRRPVVRDTSPTRRPLRVRGTA